MRALAVLLLLLPFVGACTLIDGSGSDDESLIRTDRLTYAVGETIEATVGNVTSQAVFLDNCCGSVRLSVERRQDDAWVVDPSVPPCLVACLFLPLELQPGRARSAEPLALNTPGRYRLTLRIWHHQRPDEAWDQGVSQTFTVE